MAFHDRLKEARKKKGLTQEVLGGLIDVAKTTISGYESGKSEPSMEKIIKILSVLEIDANYLWQDYLPDLKKEDTEAGRIAIAYDQAQMPIQAATRALLGIKCKKNWMQAKDEELEIEMERIVDEQEGTKGNPSSHKS